MSQVIICSTAHWSHLSPVLTIGRALADEGYEVTVLTGGEVADNVRAAGLAFVDVGPTGRPTIHEELASAERLSRNGPERFAWDMEFLMIARLAAQHRALQRLVAGAGDDVFVLYENLFLGAVPMLAGQSRPRNVAGVVGLGVLPFTLSSVDLGPFGAGMAPDTSHAGRQRHAVANIEFQRGLLGSAQQSFIDTLSDVGVEQPVPFFLDAPVLLADRFLQLSIEELSYSRSDLPPNVRFVGALPAPRYEMREPRWWDEPWDRRPVVVVTQGTTGNADLSELLEPALLALAEEPVTVIATTAKDELPTRVPDNAYVEPLIPFGDLLPRADVLVCSGGFSTVQQGLSNALPLVLAGLAEDKLEGNTRLAATGAAIDLTTQRPEVDAIRDAVREVLSSDRYRASALRLATAYRSLDALGAICATVNELVGGLHGARPDAHSLR